ncbi:hypothetical protein Tco_0152318 [Tanacetum coccineum]
MFAVASLHVPLDEIKLTKTLRFVEEPVEIMDREVKRLKRSKISLVKVRWNSKRGPEFTWERKDYMKSKYPRLVKPLVLTYVPVAIYGIISEVFVKLLLDSFGKLSIRLYVTIVCYVLLAFMSFANSVATDVANSLPTDVANSDNLAMLRIRSTEIRSGSRFDTAYPRIGYGILGISWSRDHARYLPEDYIHSIFPIRCIGLLWIRRIDLVSFVVFGECRHGYAVSSLMDTTYWSLE